MKTVKLFGLFVMIMFLMSNTVFATHLDGFYGGTTKTTGKDFTITYVKVDGMVANQNSAIFVERGTRVPVEVYLRGTGKNAYDTRVRVYMGGYEFGDVQTLSPIFEVEPGVEYTQRLVLNVPYDLEASDDYTLNIEVFDDDNSIRQTYKLRVQETRHLVNVFDVIFNPANMNVKAGQYLFATVRVENLGDNIEDTSKVTLSIPALGVQDSKFVNELITQEMLNEDSELSSTRRVSATTNDLVLQIPENTKPGDYEVVVNAEFNRGYNENQKTYTLHVDGANQVVTTITGEPAVTINVDTSAQRVTQTQGAQFKFSVSNLGQTAQTFQFEVLGTSDWATYRIDPETLTVQKNQAGEANLYVAPFEGFTGTNNFVVKVKSNGNVVAEKTLNVDVIKTTSAVDTVKKALAVAFIILAVLLVVIVLVLLVRKLSQGGEGKPVEGQTYY